MKFKAKREMEKQLTLFNVIELENYIGKSVYEMQRRCTSKQLELKEKKSCHEYKEEQNDLTIGIVISQYNSKEHQNEIEGRMDV
jgi:uncharacterized protein YwqG